MKKIILAFFIVLGAATPLLHAQMHSGEQMKNYDAVFGVTTGQRAYPYEITLLESTPAGNVLAPGVDPEMTFLISNNTDHAVQADAHFDLIAYGTRAIPGDIWLPELYKIGDLAPVPVHVDLPAKGSQIVKVKPPIPARYGGYALVADLGGDMGRRFASTCVRTFAPPTATAQYPKQSLDANTGLDVLQGLGIRAVRSGFGYTPATDTKNWAPAMAKLDAEMKSCADRHITVMLMFGAGSAPQPLDRGRPHLDANGVMLQTKQDLAWLPKCDADFQSQVTAICKKYGWPKGPITAVSLWNEPWEGISISGWGADMLRYRDMFTAMAQGVDAARKDGAQVLIAGCDSSSNTLDKLFPDGKDTFLKWLDVCSIHYQGITAPSIYRAWINRKSPNGRVKIWDTESWVANTDDRVAAVIAMNRVCGYDRSMGIFGGNVSRETKKRVQLPDKTLSQVDSFDAWSTAAAVGAVQHFIGEREFKELLFKNGLPWISVFNGLSGNADDGTVVVIGDIRGLYPDETLFRTVRGLSEVKDEDALRKSIDALPPDAPERADLQAKLAEHHPVNGLLTVSDPAGEFVLDDFFGNEVPAANGTLSVPLDDRGFFLRTKGAPGSFAHLLAALKTAKIDGYEPVEIIAHDLLAPVDQKPMLHLSVTNVLNRPVSGSVKASLGNLTLEAPPTVSLKPNETLELNIPVTGGAARPDNTYPLSFAFDAGADGSVTHDENLHVNVIAKRTIKVDGDLSDWKGVLPQTVHAASDQGPSLMEAAWLPFDKFSSSQKAGLANAYLAYDADNFYFAARIADDTPSPGMLRFEKRDDDADFYPQQSYEYDPDKTLLEEDKVWTNPNRVNAALFLPGSQTERSFTAWTSTSRAFAVDLALSEGMAKKVSFYFVDWDDHENGRGVTGVEVQDSAGNVLAKTTVKEYGSGNYASFLISGKVRIVFRAPPGFLPASLSGIFFDAAPPTASSVPIGSWAQFVGSDLTTGANWQGHYGSEGYAVFAASPHYPAYATVDLPKVDVKKTYEWPAGVRRYSYRRKPELPFGSAPTKFDNVQIAFNVIPFDQKTNMIPNPPGTMPRFTAYEDTDYEYALNPVAAEYGGGTEIWRSTVPGMPEKDFFPRQPASPFDGPVKKGQLSIHQEGNTRIVEAAIPWSEIPLVKKAMDANRTIKFSFRVNDDKGPSMELAEGRSVSKKNPHAFHPAWVPHWANEVEFKFAK